VLDPDIRFHPHVARYAVLVVAVAALVGATPAPTKSRPLRVGFVSDLVSLNARPVVRQIVAGMTRAHRELGVEFRVVARPPNESPLPSIASLARAGYDVIVGFSFSQGDAMDAVALDYPRTKFVLVDFPQSQLPHRPKNLLGIVFREQEAGYLAGYLAALEERRRPGKDAIGSIGAYPNPPISRFIAGYQAGARKADPGITLLNAFSLNYADTATCGAAALSQIARGAGAVFAVSGDCGLGALEAAKRKGVWGVAAETDESHLGPSILTSAVKHADIAVFDALRSIVQRRFRGGDLSLGLRQGAVGLGRISPRVPRWLVHEVKRIRAEIVAGRIKGIPTYPPVPSA
jgi:basic membrane protein A and related proteins